MRTRFHDRIYCAAALAFVLLLFSVGGCQDTHDDNLEPEGEFADHTPDKERQDRKPVSGPLVDRIFSGRTDDLSAETRAIRILVSYSKTNFFETGGQIKGFEADLMRQYEKFIQKSYSRAGPPKTIIFIALPFEDLIPALINGRGDIVAAGMTITPERRKRVDFSDPYIKNINEIIVTAPGVKGLEQVSDLSGRKIHVVSGSSHLQHLEKLNQRFADKGLAPVEIVPAAKGLGTEELMEMVNAGIFELTVADSHMAALWSRVYKNIRTRGDLVIHSGGRIAWAVRKNNPRLLKSLNSFVQRTRQGTLLGNLLMARYFQKTKWIRNPLSKTKKAKLEKLGGLFRKYAGMYGFDWLRIAALAYQESGFEQKSKSRRGAVGVMQIKPQTAADPNVNIKNIFQLENNIHAGVKYLAFLRDRYFNDPVIGEDARIDFTIAAYNAGPARINALRRKALEKGFDPNKWFSHVEHIARKEIGVETVRYVANVNKYTIAYRSMNAAWKNKKRKADTLMN